MLIISTGEKKKKKVSHLHHTSLNSIYLSSRIHHSWLFNKLFFCSPHLVFHLLVLSFYLCDFFLEVPFFKISCPLKSQFQILPSLLDLMSISLLCGFLDFPSPKKMKKPSTLLTPNTLSASHAALSPFLHWAGQLSQAPVWKNSTPLVLPPHYLLAYGRLEKSCCAEMVFNVTFPQCCHHLFYSRAHFPPNAH